MPQQAKTREKRKSGITSSHIFHGCTRQGTSFSSPVVLSLPKTSVSVTKSPSSGDLGSAADTSGVSQSRTRSARLSLSTTPEVSAKTPVKRTLDLSSQKLACVPSKQRKMSYNESISAKSEECVETRLNKEVSDSANTSKLQDLLSNIQCLQSSPKSPHQARSRKAETTNFVVHTDTPSTRTPVKLVSKEKNLKPLKISEDQRHSERLVERKYSQLNMKAADVMKKESPTAQCEDNEILVGKNSSELSPATHRHVTRVRSTKITAATYIAQVDAAESCRISDFAKPATDLAKCHPPVDITTGDRAVHIKTDTLEAFTETVRVKSPQSRASAAESGTGIAKSSKVEAEIVKLNTKDSGCDDTHLSRKNAESTATPGFDGTHSAKTKCNNETYSGEAITKSVTVNNTVEEITVQKSTLAVANTIKSDTKDVDNTQFTAITDFSVSSTDDLDLSDSATTVHHVADAMIVKSPVQSTKQESGMVESRTEFTKSTPSYTVKSLMSPVTKTDATREDVEADAACSFINISFTEKSVLNKDNASESIKGDDTAKSTRSAHPLKFITGVDIAKSFVSKKDLKMLSESDSAAEVDIPISLSKTDDGKSSISKGEIAQVVKSVTTANANRSELVSCMTDSSEVKVSGSDTGKTSDSVTNGETAVTRESDEMTLVTKANSMITSHAIASSEMLSLTKSGIGNAPATQLSIAEGALATVSDEKTLAFTNIGKLAVTSAGNVNTVVPTSFTGNTIANTGSTEEIHVTTSSGEIQVTTAGSGKLDKTGSFVKTEDTTATTGKTAITTVRIGKTAVTNEETLTPSASTGTTTFRACGKETAVSKASIMKRIVTTVSTGRPKVTTASTEEASVSTASTGKTAVGTVITGMLEVTTASTEETDITTASTRKTNFITVSTEKPEVTTASTEETTVATTNSENTSVSTVNTVKPKVTTTSTKETAVTKVSTGKPAVTELSNRKTNITTASAEETAVTIAGAWKTTVIALNTEKPKVTTAVTGETAVSSVTPGKPKVTTASTEKRTVATVSTGKLEISTASTKETFATANTGKTTVSTVSIGEPVVTTARTEDVTVTTASSRKPTDVTVSTGKPKDTTSPGETAVTMLSTVKTAVTTMSIGKPKVITEGTGKPKVTTISTGGTVGITAGTVKPKVTTGSTGKTPVITASTGKPKVTTVSHEETTVTIASAGKTAVTTASIGKTAVATVSMGKPKVTTASTGETTVTLACTGKTAVGTTSSGKAKVTTASTGKAVVVIANTGNPTVTAVSTGEAADTTASTRKTTVTTASSGKTVVATANIGKTKVTTASTGETTVTTASTGKTGFATMSAERTKVTTANNRKITATTLSTEKAKMTTGSTVKTTVTTVNTGKTRVSTASSGKATFTTLDTGKTVVANANTGETKVTSVSTGETKVTTASTGETTVTTASIGKTGVATMSTEKTKVTTANTGETTVTSASTGKTGVATMSTEKTKMTTGSTVKTTVTTVNTGKTRVSAASSGKATFTTLDTGKTVVATANTGKTKVTSVSTGETKVTTASTGETTVTTASTGKTGVSTMSTEKTKVTTANTGETTVTTASTGKTGVTTTSTEKTKVTTANTGETTVTTASTGKTGVSTMSTEKTKVTTANTGETTVTTASTGKTGVTTTSTEKAKVTTANSRKITATTLNTEKAKVTIGSTVKTAVTTANSGKTTVTTASTGKTTFTTLNPGKTVVANANTGKTKVTTVSTGETTVTTASTGKTGVATMSTKKTKVTTANTGETTVTTASTGKTGVVTTSTEKTRVTTANTGETTVTTASTGKTGVATTSTKKAKVTTANDMKITATTLNTEKAKVTIGSTVKTAVTTANSGKTTVTTASTGKTTFITLNPGKTVVATANTGKTQVTTVSTGETKVTTASTGETTVTTASTGKTGVATMSTEKAKVTTANDMKITATTLSTEKAKVTIGSTVKTAVTTANSGKTVTTASTGKTTFTTLNPGKTVVANANTGKTKVTTVSTGETKVTTASTEETTVTTASTGKTGVATTSTKKTRVTTANTGETTVTTASTGKTGVATTSTEKTRVTTANTGETTVTASTGKTGVATTSTKKANKEITVTILSTEKAKVTTGSTVKTAVTTANTGKTPVTTGKTTVTIANTGKTAVTTASIGETTVTTASSRKTTTTASTGKTPVATAGTGKIVDVALKSKSAESLTISDQLGGYSNNGIIDKRPGDEPFFDHVVIFANALYKHHLEELSCFQVTVITEDNLCFKDVPEAICRSYSERTNKTLWILPLGIHSIIEVHPNHDCKRYGCVNQLTTISYEGCIKPSEKDVTDRISDMISHAKLLRETVQRELGPESLVMLVPLIPAAVIQEDAIKDHRVLHSVVSRNNSYSANNAVLSALHTIYNSFCEAWSYLVIKPVKNRLTSVMVEFTKMNQGSNFIFINRDIDDSFVFIPWIKMMKSIIKLALSRCPQGTFGHPRNIKDLNTPSHALPTAGAVPINLPYQVTGSSLKQEGQNQAVSLFQQIIVLGNRDISTGLKDLSKYFPIQFEYKNISFDDDGMNTILKCQKKWQDQTLWFILSDLSCLITPVDYEPKCSMFKCPKPVRVFDVKKFGDYPGHTKTTFKSAAENATHLIKEFVASLTEHLEENSAVFLAPVSPFYVIKGDTPSYSHEYLHRIVKADPNIPVVIGRKEDWEEFSFQLKNEWTAMLKSTMSSHAEPIDLLNKYLKSDSKILEFVSTFPRACHSFTQDSWNEVVRGLLIFFANAKMEDWDAEESLCHSDSEFCSEELSGALVTSQEQQNEGLAVLQSHNMQSGRSCKEDSNDTSCILSSLSSVQLSAVFSPKETDDLSVKKQADPPIRRSDTPTKLQLESAKPSVEPCAKEPTVPCIMQETNPLTKLPIKSFGKKPTEFSVEPHARLSEDHLIKHKTDPQARVSTESLTEQSKEPFVKLLGGNSAKLQIEPLSNLQAKPAELSPEATAANRVRNQFSDKYSVKLSEHQSEPRAKMSEESPVKYPRNSSATFAVEHPVCEENVADRTQIEIVPNKRTCKKDVNSDQFSIKTSRKEMRVEAKSDDIILETVEHKFADTVSGNDVGNSEKAVDDSSPSRNDLYQDELDTCNSESRLDERTESRCDFVRALSLEMNSSDKGNSHDKNFRKKEQRYDSVKLNGRNEDKCTLSGQQDHHTKEYFLVRAANISMLPLTVLHKVFQACGALDNGKFDGVDLLFRFKSMKFASLCVAKLNNMRVLDRFLKVKLEDDFLAEEYDYDYQDELAFDAEVEETLRQQGEAMVSSVKEWIETGVNVYNFKVKLCINTKCDSPGLCLNYHTSTDKRRSLDVFEYSDEMCQEMPKRGRCFLKDACPFAHTAVEKDFHVKQFRSLICPGWSKSNFCQKTEEVCPFVHPESPDSFYHDSWQDLYVEGLSNTTIFLVEAFRNMFKLPTASGVQILVITPSNLVARLLKIAVCDLADIFLQTVVTAAHKDMILDNATVVIGTPSVLAAILVMEIEKETHHLSNIRAVIIDDITTILKDSLHPNQLSFISKNILDKSGLNKVVVTEKLGDHEMEVASDLLRTKFVKVSLEKQKVKLCLSSIKESAVEKLADGIPERFKNCSRSSKGSKRTKCHLSHNLHRKPNSLPSTLPPSERLPATERKSHKRRRSSSSSLESSSARPLFSPQVLEKSTKRRTSSSPDTSSSSSSFGTTKSSSIKRICHNFDHETKKLFLVEEKRLKLEHQVDYQTYSDVPEAHPEYEEKYRIFRTKYQKMYAGEDLKECKRLWLRFWEEAMKVELEEVWQSKRAKLVQQFEAIAARKKQTDTAKRKKRRKEKYQDREHSDAASSDLASGVSWEPCEEIIKIRKAMFTGEGEFVSDFPVVNLSCSQNPSDLQEKCITDKTKLPQALPQALATNPLTVRHQTYLQDEDFVSLQHLKDVPVKEMFPCVSSTSQHKSVTCYLSRDEMPLVKEFLSHTLSLLIVLCKSLGILGPAIKIIIHKVLNFGTNTQGALEVLAEEDNVLLMRMASEKLKSLSEKAKGKYKNMLLRGSVQTEKLLEYATASSLTEKKTICGIDVEKVAKATLNKDASYIVKFIENALAYEGIVNPTFEDINEIFLAVSSQHFHMALQS
ncbi:uncharacterized protein [Panulirus ornatus]|uniref:uncharacterized protein n=1 Tax=Panulirus ornatus TaxID=150431 RepID=UPI003A8B45D4